MKRYIQLSEAEVLWIMSQLSKIDLYANKAVRDILRLLTTKFKDNIDK